MVEITQEFSERDEFERLSQQMTLTPDEAARCAELGLKFSGKSIEVYEELSVHGFNGGYHGDDEEMKHAMRWCVEYHFGYYLPEAEYLRREYDRRERAWNWDRAHPKTGI